MTGFGGDWEAHNVSRLSSAILELVDSLPAEEAARVRERAALEPYSFKCEPVFGGWLVVRVGREDPLEVGRVHLGALRVDGAGTS